MDYFDDNLMMLLYSFGSLKDQFPIANEWTSVFVFLWKKESYTGSE